MLFGSVDKHWAERWLLYFRILDAEFAYKMDVCVTVAVEKMPLNGSRIHLLWRHIS